MPNPENVEPHKFQPGQSGNPAGFSAKGRRKKAVREAISVLLSHPELPELIQKKLHKGLKGFEGMGGAELVAVELMLQALTNRSSEVRMRAIHEIIGTEPKELAISTPDGIEAGAYLRPTGDREKEIRKLLANGSGEVVQ